MKNFSEILTQYLLDSNDIIFIDVDKSKDLGKNLWVDMRMRECHSPVIVFGIEGEKEFTKKPEHLVFVDRPYQYSYIALPLNLFNLLKVMSSLIPVYNKGELNNDIQNYSTIEDILETYLHHLNNKKRKEGLSNKNFSESIAILDKIKYILLNFFSSIFTEDIKNLFEETFQKPSLNKLECLEKKIRKIIPRNDNNDR